MKKRGKWAGVFGQIEDITIVRAVRNGLIHITPVLIIGAMALIFMTFPVEAYQQFLATFLDGFLSMFFGFRLLATFVRTPSPHLHLAFFFLLCLLCTQQKIKLSQTRMPS